MKKIDYQAIQEQYDKECEEKSNTQEGKDFIANIVNSDNVHYCDCYPSTLEYWHVKGNPYDKWAIALCEDCFECHMEAWFGGKIPKRKKFEVSLAYITSFPSGSYFAYRNDNKKIVCESGDCSELEEFVEKRTGLKFWDNIKDFGTL